MSIVKLSNEKKSSDSVSDDEKIASNIIKIAIEKLKSGDVGAHFEPEVISAARFIKSANIPAFMRIKKEIKNAHSDSNITEWEKLVNTKENSSAEDTSRAGELVLLVNDSAKLFHNSDGEGFITIEREDHLENWQIGSTGFKDWLTFQCYKILKFCPNEQSIKQAITTLTGIAKFDGEEHEVFMRCAPYKFGYIIDLTNSDWQAIQVDSTGYKLLDEIPVKFVRSNTIEELPIPTTPNLELLWKYVNIVGSDKFLLLGFILESFRSGLPFVLLALIGEQGSGKSSAHKAIRALTDPNSVPLRAAPKSVRDVRVTALNNWQASFENVSHLTSDLQDCLCYFCTGGGSAERQLYSNKDESIFQAMCPIILNSIENIISRPDLVDRSLIIDVPAIPAEKKIREALIKSNFEKDKPKILAGILELFSHALKKLPNVQIDKPQRMVDFTFLGEAMLLALKDHDFLSDKTLMANFDAQFGDFNALYAANRKKSLDEAITGSPAASALIDFINDEKTWQGTLKQLKNKLEAHKYMRPGDGWPKSERGLSSVLKRMKPALRENGVIVEFLGHHRNGSHVKVSLIQKNKKQENNRHNRHIVTNTDKPAPNDAQNDKNQSDSLIL